MWCLFTLRGSLPSPDKGDFSFSHTKILEVAVQLCGVTGVTLQWEVKAWDGIVGVGEGGWPGDGIGSLDKGLLQKVYVSESSPGIFSSIPLSFHH